MPSSMAEDGNKVTTERRALHVLDENAFEGDEIEAEYARQTQVNFYRGAPPVWLNFHLAEQNPNEDAFIKREGYEELRARIMEHSWKKRKTSYECLTHEPGSGGTTLAMQLLWDLRKFFRCAVLANPKSESTATEVINLYTGSKPNDCKTVLLLMQDGDMHTLRQSVMQQMSEREIHSDGPIVVILKCERKEYLDEDEEGVLLRQNLSDNEKDQFDRKREILSTKFPTEYPQFIGFNIMEKRFCKDYAKTTCEVLNQAPVSNGLRLTACMCLLNSYVPGSFFLMNDCEIFLQGSLFDQAMEPFRDLVVIFNPGGSGEERVRMAHPMIAEQGTLSLHDAGVYRSHTAKDLLSLLNDCGDYLKLFVKDLLIERGKGRFSKLINDIQQEVERGNTNCVSVLEEGIKTFGIGVFPQTLSRFYYLVLGDYSRAEMYAMQAQQIDRTNSFFADTIGQVHKHHLNGFKDVSDKLQIWSLAKKAFKAFDDQQSLAENEQEKTETLGQKSKFNYFGKVGYLQVATTLYEKVCNPPGLGTELLNYKDAIKEKATFINMLFTYSKEGLKEKDPVYVLEGLTTCYKYYLEKPLPKYVGTGPTEDLLHLLHQNWPKDTQNTQEPMEFNFKEKIESMRCSFQATHEKYLRSRYLLPLLFLKREEVMVRLPGQVRHYKVYTYVASEEIQLDVDPLQKLDLWKSGPVSFQLGFTIRGPTAYDIKYE